MTPQQNIEALLSRLPHQLQVSFALYCAKDAIPNLTEEVKAPALAAIGLTEKWLNNPSSVSAKELEDAANAANSTAYSAASAAYSAAHAAHAASAAYAANSAAHAASAAYAANSAARGAYSAAYDEKILQHEKELIRIIKDLTGLERVIYNLTKDEYETAAS